MSSLSIVGCFTPLSDVASNKSIVTCIDSADEYVRVNNTFSSIDHFFVGHERY